MVLKHHNALIHTLIIAIIVELILEQTYASLYNVKSLLGLELDSRSRSLLLV